MADSAAKQALEKLADELTCGVCLESYTDPKLLQCFHVFCKNCLERIPAQGQQGQPLNCIGCPNCRRPTQLPPNGISGLQAAFHIDHLIEIQEAFEKLNKPGKHVQCDKCSQQNATDYCRICGFICEICNGIHATWKELASHEVISLDQLEGDVTKLVPPKKTIIYCPEHPRKELDLYCETCDELICRDCIVRVHRDHQYDLAVAAFPKHRDTIFSQLQPVKEQLSTVNQAIEGLDVRCQQIKDQRVFVEANIHKTIQQLQEALEGRKMELISQLDRITQQKLESLAAQRNQFKLVQTQLSSCLNFVSESLRTGSDGEILAMKNPVGKQIKEITAGFKEDALELEQHADIRFAFNESTEAYQHFGKVYTYTYPVSPENCYATGKNLADLTVGEATSATLHVVDQKGQEYEKPVDVACELVSCKDGTTVKPDVKRKDRNKYEISYTPATRGRHQLHIRVEGKPIKGSPFTVVALRKLGTPVRTISDLNRPWGITVNKKGQLVVAESEAHRISILTPVGARVNTFGTHGSAQSQFDHPHGVAVDKDDYILVADNDNHRIQKFTANYRFSKSVGIRGNSGHLRFYYPGGIGVSHKNSVYVCDTCNHQVQILKADLTFYKSFGSKGTGNGNFEYPQDVAFDSAGNVYIVDNHCIQVFTEDGWFLRMFGKEGSGDGDLNYPSSICIDSDDIVYIADRNNHRVCVFTGQGQFLRSFGSHGNQPGQFNAPTGITVDSDGLVYVCDFGNNCLQVF